MQGLYKRLAIHLMTELKIYRGCIRDWQSKCDLMTDLTKEVKTHQMKWLL